VGNHFRFGAFMFREKDSHHRRAANLVLIILLSEVLPVSLAGCQSDPQGPRLESRDGMSAVSALGNNDKFFDFLRPRTGMTPWKRELAEFEGVLPGSAPNAPVRAVLFPGRTDRRALIISGIHGDEAAGIKVVERLRSLLRSRAAAQDPSFFTTMLVPVVIPKTLATGQRYVPGGIGLVESGDNKKDWKVVWHDVEPNLNLPLPGENYDMAHSHGARSPTDPELFIKVPSRSGNVHERPPRGQRTSIRMLRETRMLVQLIEHFQPERLAAIHAHSREDTCYPCKDGQQTECGGEGPGIFVDPRGIDPISHRVRNYDQFKADRLLATHMFKEGLHRLERDPLPVTDDSSASFSPFAGNTACLPFTVEYFSPRQTEGNSLGDWAPVPTPGRAGITTLTIELPKYRRINAAASRVIDLYRDLLADVFLTR
jgi:hypothetical protein